MFASKRSDCVILNGYLFSSLQLCILYSSLREQVIQELHGDNHLKGRDKTLAMISSDYYWFKLISDVAH